MNDARNRFNNNNYYPNTHFVFFLVCIGVTCVNPVEPTGHVVQPVSYPYGTGHRPQPSDEYARRSLPVRFQEPFTPKPDKIVERSEDLPVEARTIDDVDDEPTREDETNESPEKNLPYFENRSKQRVEESSRDRGVFNGSFKDGNEFESLRKIPKFMTEEWTRDEEAGDDNGGEDYTAYEDNNEDTEESQNKERLRDRSEQILRRPKKNHLSDDKYLSKPQFFAYSKDPKEEGDQNPSASHHHKDKHHSEKHEKGGGKEFKSHHHSSSGKKGDKGYKGYHKYEKGKKGHHDKESHKGAYKDKKGKKKKHKEEASHFGEHHKHEKGKKGAKYGESGEHKKGHSTKGEHNIHKKDEYLKKHEFYDEHHEGGEHEKHGGFHAHHGHKHGAKKKTGHHKSGYHEDHHGKKGHHIKGGHHKDHKGHKKASGHEDHHSHKKEYSKKDGHKEGKKWGYSKKDKRHAHKR